MTLSSSVVYITHFLKTLFYLASTTVVPPLERSIPPKAIPLIRPDFKLCTEIVKYC